MGAPGVDLSTGLSSSPDLGDNSKGYDVSHLMFSHVRLGVTDNSKSNPDFIGDKWLAKNDLATAGLAEVTGQAQMHSPGQNQRLGLS